MGEFVLAASHLSSVFASSVHVPTHAVSTQRRDLPLATSLSDMPEDHASHSSVFHSQETGHILIRVVQGGLAVELVSLSYNVSPIRFLFPASVIPAPAVRTYGGEVYLIVVTSVGLLFRITLPYNRDGQLWHDALPNHWCRDWQIPSLTSNVSGLVHVHDPHDVSIASQNSILRLTSLVAPSEAANWIETKLSTKSWLRGFIPSNSDPADEIVSMATVAAPTDCLDLFSVSRNRTVRRWSSARGCIEQVELGSVKGNSDEPYPLLDAAVPQNLIKTFHAVLDTSVESDANPSLFVIVFVPTPTSPTSGGSFQIFKTQETGHTRLELMTSFDTSAPSAHCRLQDFTINGTVLTVLWERYGQSMVESAFINLQAVESNQQLAWIQARLDQHSELNQAAMDELLLQPGSLTSKFLQSVLRPGVFSVITLRAALQEYREHYLSLPGPRPVPLLASYSTLSEAIAAIVGCSVSLTRDPATGVVLQDQYWSALRRDWEGFVARCTEIERSARWPLCLGTALDGHTLVVERERIAESVEEDVPLKIRRQLSSEAALDDSYRLLKICWELRSKLPPALLQRIETETLNILRQDFSFPFCDIVAESAARLFSKVDIDRDIEEWLTSSMAEIESIDSEVQSCLDLIGGLEKAVKQEEDEVEMIIPASNLEWIRALATSYVTETVEVRYDFAIALSTLLFFTSDALRPLDPVVLAEVLSVIRGVTTYRYLCRQPAGDLEGAKPAIQEAMTPTDDVVARMSSLYVSRGTRNPVPTYSLAHHLLSDLSHPSLIPPAAHVFLDKLGLLSGVTPATTTKSEVLICEKLRLAGYRESARYLLTCLPKTPAVCYILGKLWIDAGRGDEAVMALLGVAGSFGTGEVSGDDMDALNAVLQSNFLTTDCDYYLHVAGLFKLGGMVSNEVKFLRLALSVWQDGREMEASAAAWSAIVKGYSDLRLYEDAYTAIVSSPHHEERTRHVSDLVYKMCDEDALDRLLSMNFVGLVQQVDQALSFKARNADPRGSPNWSQILYTWYTVRGDYRNAALAMYLRSRKLSDLPHEPSSPLGYAGQQLEALSIAMNALGLVEGRNNFLVVTSSGVGLHARKRRKLGNHLPVDQTAPKQRNVEIITLADIEKEYTHLSANIELIKRDPNLLRSGDILTPWVTISKLTQEGQYDLAMHTAKALSVDMSELFQRLASQCLQLAEASDTGLMEAASTDWLLTDKVSSWPGTPAERGWRYLRQCLERYDAPETDFSYSKAVLETLILNDADSPPPPWLLSIIETHHPEYLIRLYLRYGKSAEALEQALKLVRKSTSSWGTMSSKQSASTWLPYNIIESVLKTTEVDATDDARIPRLREQLDSELSNRILRLQKHYELSTSVH